MILIAGAAVLALGLLTAGYIIVDFADEQNKESERLAQWKK